MIEFVGLIVYDDEGAPADEARRQTVAKLDQIAEAHAELCTPSLRCDVLSDLMTLSHVTVYGFAGLFTGHRTLARDLAVALHDLTTEVFERLRPTRLLIIQVRETPEIFAVLDDADARFDVDRYVNSTLYARQRPSVAPLLAAPVRWFSVDPVWRYFRRRDTAPFVGA